jgi:hypothetical protein
MKEINNLLISSHENFMTVGGQIVVIEIVYRRNRHKNALLCIPLLAVALFYTGHEEIYF